MTVIRIEKDGVGFFQHREVRQENLFLAVRNKHTDFPLPYQDNIDLYLNDKEWFFGYTSIEMLESWVTKKELKQMNQYGFNVILFEVEEYQKGDFQIAFTKESITFKKDITSLFLTNP